MWCRWSPRSTRRPGSLPLSQHRNIAIVAAVVAAACALAAAPLAAFGDADEAAAPSAAQLELLEARAEVAEINEQAQEIAPPAVGNTCVATADVDVIGEACRTPEGLLRVEQADGNSYTVHGVDAPPDTAASLAPGSEAAVSGADASDIACVPATGPHYVLAYARPGNVASRYATIAPKLRTEIYKLSAFIDAESRAVDPKASKRLPMRCDGATPTVLDVALGGLTAGTAKFQDIVNAFEAQGHEFNGEGTGNIRYIVYYDSPGTSSGAAGTGHIFAKDSTPGAGNANNKGGLYAVEYRYDTGGGVPHWEVLAHEVVHTMGGVTASAPHSSGAEVGHCNDGLDVMCYADGGSTSNYNGGVCATKVLDCNRDDYFNPAPAAGSYLANSWNVAATYNRYLVHGAAADTGAPTAVGNLAQSGASNVAVGVTWAAATDDTGIGAYVVSVRTPGGAWREVASTGTTSHTVTGLAPAAQYEVGVAARDRDGNVGPSATITVATSRDADRQAPARPAAAKVRVTASAAVFTWRKASDNVGVVDYELRRVTNPARRQLRSAGRTTTTTISVPLRGLKPGVRYRFELVARDGASNVSAAAPVTLVVPKDTRRPTAPARLRVVPSRVTASLTWTPSRDNKAVTQYRVFQLISGRWSYRGAVSGSGRRVTINQLRSRTSYTFRLVARDAAGNQSVASRAVTFRTR